MPTSIHYNSPVDSDSMVLVTKENGWKNIKVYANGSLQYSAPTANDLKKVKRIQVEGFGTIELQLRNELEITVDGTPYEMVSKDAEDKVTNVSSIFWVLTGFATIGFILLLLLSSTFEMNPSLMFIIALQLFAILVYGATAILLAKGVYWFYFVGAGVYTFFSALELLDIEYQLSSFGTIAMFIIRFFLLAMVLRIIPTIIKEMRRGKPNAANVLDQ